KRDLWMPNRGETLTLAVADAAQRFFADVRRTLAPVALKNDGERFTLPEDLIDDQLQALWLGLDTALEELYAHGKLGSERLRDDEHDEDAEELRILAGRCSGIRNDLAAIADRK